MQLSDEVIEILEYLCQKLGITINWASDNVLPYIQALCEKFIKWEIASSIVWICIAIVVGVILFIMIRRIDTEDDLEWTIYKKIGLIGVVIISFLIISTQVFDIVECYTFPEKVVYDYVLEQIKDKNNR